MLRRVKDPLEAKNDAKLGGISEEWMHCDIATSLRHALRHCDIAKKPFKNKTVLKKQKKHKKAKKNYFPRPGGGYICLPNQTTRPMIRSFSASSREI